VLYKVAAVDDSADTVTALAGQTDSVYGIGKGYEHGDLSFTADRWNGSANDCRMFPHVYLVTTAVPG